MKTFVMVFVLACIAAAQTQPRLAQLKAPATTDARLLVVTSAGIVLAQLDAAAFTLDLSTSPPTLRLKPFLTAVPTFHLMATIKADGTFDLPSGRVYDVQRNGVGQAVGVDYAITGNVLRFNSPVDADETIKVAVWQ